MHIADKAMSQLSELARTFLPAFRRAFPEVGASERLEEGNLWITIPARCAEVGPLEVMVDSEEATVYLGEHTHTHISPWTHADVGADVNTTVTAATIDYVSDVLADKVVIWSHYVEGQQVSGGAYHREVEEPTWRPSGAAAYLWSGAKVSVADPDAD